MQMLSFAIFVISHLVHHLAMPVKCFFLVSYMQKVDVWVLEKSIVQFLKTILIETKKFYVDIHNLM